VRVRFQVLHSGCGQSDTWRIRDNLPFDPPIRSVPKGLSQPAQTRQPDSASSIAFVLLGEHAACCCNESLDVPARSK